MREHERRRLKSVTARERIAHASRMRARKHQIVTQRRASSRAFRWAVSRTGGKTWSICSKLRPLWSLDHWLLMRALAMGGAR